MKNLGASNGKKVALGVTALVGAGAVLVGLGYAFFSDVITGGGSVTAGTLDITGTIGLDQNNATATLPITNFNPGDVLTLDASSISNSGTKSAWIRSVFEFTNLDASLAGLVYVCTGLPTSDFAATQAALIAASFADGGFAASSYVVAGEGTPACRAVTADDVTNSTMFGAPATYTAASNVIDGSAEDDNGTAGTQATWTPDALPLIYFDAAADNDAQAGNIAFTAMIQALQYRNNTTAPDEAAWETVVDTAFGS